MEVQSHIALETCNLIPKISKVNKNSIHLDYHKIVKNLHQTMYIEPIFETLKLSIHLVFQQNFPSNIIVCEWIQLIIVIKPLNGGLF